MRMPVSQPSGSTAFAVVSVGFGLLLDALYGAFAIEPTAAAGRFHEHLGTLQWVCAAVLGGLIGWHAVRGARRRLAK